MRRRLDESREAKRSEEKRREETRRGGEEERTEEKRKEENRRAEKREGEKRKEENRTEEKLLPVSACFCQRRMPGHRVKALPEETRGTLDAPPFL